MNILDSFSLKGKKAIIIEPQLVYGKEIVSGLASAGADVFLAGPDTDEFKGISEYIEQNGNHVSGVFDYVQGTEEESLSLKDKVIQEMGSVDIIVENSSSKKLRGWSGHSFNDIYEDLKFTQLGVMMTIRELGTVMAEKEGGSLILVSDYAALVGCDPYNYTGCDDFKKDDFSLDYGYARGSYVNYARQTAGFLGEHGCRANCIAYGPLEGTVPDSFTSQFIRHSHIKRLANGSDVASAAVFFASDASAFITGTTLAVDGGYTAK